jgi:hypothetical protein
VRFVVSADRPHGAASSLIRQAVLANVTAALASVVVDRDAES